MTERDKLEYYRSTPLMAEEFVYIMLLSTFLATIIITNVITARYFTIKNLTFTSGAITYHLTFLITDITSEMYGKHKAQLMVWMGFIVSIFMLIILKIAQSTTAHHNSPVTQQLFQEIFKPTPSIVIGSMAAYIASQFTDIAIFSFIKKITKGKYLWLRNNLSTLISQLIDTIVFALITWTIWPMITNSPSNNNTVIHSIVINEYILKVAFIILSTPILYTAVHLIKKFTATSRNYVEPV
jgi:uncharacterized integral membrane protein (TIGR00697 family)